MHVPTKLRGPTIATAFAAGSLANLAWVLRITPSDTAISPAFFASYLCVVLAAHLGVALVLAGRLDERPWSAIAFALPLALATLPVAYTSLGRTMALAIAAGIGLVILAWSLLRGLRGAPLVAAAAGSGVASEFMRFRAVELAASPVAWSAVAGIGAWILVGLLVAVLAGRASAWLRHPGSAASAALGAAAIAVGFLATLGHAGPAPAAPAPGGGVAGSPPVVLIVLDTVRADHLPTYGYERPTMPHLHHFATTQAVVVERAYSNGSWSLPSHASLFTGLHPPRHGAHGPFADDAEKPPGGYALRPEVWTLAELLGEAGYWTVGISANFIPLSGQHGLERGFQHYEARPAPAPILLARSPWRIPHLAFSPLAPVGAFLDRLPPFSLCEFFLGVRYRRAREITDDVLAAVEAARERPFFLFVNYLDAHQPYFPPVEQRERFEGVRWWLGLHGLDNRRQHAVLRGERTLDAEEYEHLRALYDGELLYLDGELRRLLEGLAEHPAWTEMLVVITADHGESLGGHGLVAHATHLYEELIRVPLVIKPGPAPGSPAPGSAIAGPMESVDVFATILEHTGISPPAPIDGVPWGRGRTHARAWHYANDPLGLVSPRFEHELRAVIGERWKLIESSRGHVELYDLEADPGERRNLAEQRPAEIEHLAGLLGPREPRRPGLRPGEDPELIERLRALDYLP